MTIGFDLEKATLLGTLLFNVQASTQERWTNVNLQHGRQ